MPSPFKTKEVKSEKLILTLQIELNRSSLTEDEAAERISMLLERRETKVFSELIVFLLRETQSSTWELKTCKIEEEKI